MEADQNLLLRAQATSSSDLLKQDDEKKNSTNPEGNEERLETIDFNEDEKTDEPRDPGNSSTEGSGEEEETEEEDFPSRAPEGVPVSGLPCLEETDDTNQGYLSTDEQSEGTARKVLVDITVLRQALEAISVSQDCSYVEQHDDGLENSRIDEQQAEPVRGDGVVPETPRAISGSPSSEPEPEPDPEPPVVHVEVTAIDLPPSLVFHPALPGDVP